MTTRRHLLAAAATLAPLALAFKSATAGEGASEHKKTSHASGEKADFLFVQNARSIVHADGRLTLKGISPATVMFSDRPERIAGHMTTARFVPFWSEGEESFLLDPPNATLSFLENRDMEDVVLVLQEPELVGDDLSYQVRVLEGTLPAEAGPASLFIDVIGMPLTPVSFAGAGRRAYRRAVIY
jgi:hypothetical protein